MLERKEASRHPKVRITLIGPLPPPIGGATILFEQLVDDLLKDDEVSLSLINTSRSNTKSRWISLLHAVRVTFLILASLPKTDVMSFHAAIGGLLLYSPILVFICKCTKRAVVLRAFGGRIADWYRAASPWKQWIFRHSVLRANVVLLETKSSVEFFRSWSFANVEWYPNSRRDGTKENIAAERSVANRFVFVGQVRSAKGVAEILAASELLDSRMSIDFYGPLIDDFSPQDFAKPGVQYKGVLQGNDVVSTLQNYDVLLLPTYWPNEGYPGVILEAYMAGIPVITTRIGGITEIVDESSGLFVEPKDPSGVATAMSSLASDSELYSRLRNGAKQKRAEFRASTWSKRFVEICTEWQR
jgi:glycosyltransferase involved in cell wall biosynthesis